MGRTGEGPRKRCPLRCFCWRGICDSPWSNRSVNFNVTRQTILINHPSAFGMNSQEVNNDKLAPILLFIAVCALLIGSVPLTVHSSSALRVVAAADNLSATTNQQLAQARRGTAKYHDIAQAEADGYVNINVYESGEGFHYVNFGLVDANFDPEHPEVLLYAPVPHENRMELVGVEYVVPLSLSSDAPAGFAGNADVWRPNSEGLGLWELNAWIWLHNSDGIFTFKNPRVP